MKDKLNEFYFSLNFEEYFSRYFALEAFAVVTGAAYTVLITYGSIWCWPAALLSSVAFIYLLLQKKLIAETILQVFYVLMAVYGWVTWGMSDGGLKVVTAGWEVNIVAIVLATMGMTAMALLLKKFTNARLPWVDSFTTVFSIMATWLMVNSVFENWIYWIVIDTVSIAMYFSRGLYLSTFLFAAYTILAINGLIQWLHLL